MSGVVVSLAVRRPWPWANVESYDKRKLRWAFALPVITDSYPAERMETVMVDPDGALDHGCLVVMQYHGGTPHLAHCFVREGRGYRGRFVTKGSEDETIMLGGGPVASRRDIATREFVRIIGRVIGEPRRCPRYRTWDDPD